MNKKIKIIIADDKQKYRRMLVEMLEPLPATVLGEAENGRQLMQLLHLYHPDVILLDLDMPVMNGNEAYHLLSRRFPDIKVIILSHYSESELIENYIQRGVSGYIPKDEVDETVLQEALNCIGRGGVFLPSNLRRRPGFTGRQRQIMQLMFAGHTNDEIAREINISKRAVEKQRNRIYLKSGAEKAVDFYKYAFTKGLQFLG